MITGRRVTRAANQLQQADGSIAEDAPSIANCLASSIAQSSSTNHYTPAFQRHKSKIEAKTISFKSKNNETYNEPITLLEFKNALNKSHNTAVGPDMVHYSFLKHLPCTAQQIVVDAFNHEFYNLIDKYPGINIYTDGSKSNDTVACAFTCSTYQIQFGLPAQMSIYTAELIAIEQALIFIETVKDEDQFNICSDSLSSLTALSNCDITHPYLLSILTKQNNLVRKGKKVVFIWCPSHVGILGNEVADRQAKQALVMPVTKLPLPHTDYKSPIRSYVKSLWQNEWDGETDNKLHIIQPVISEWKQGPQIDRRGEIVLACARIGHSHLTHGYLLRREVAPFCIPCQSLLTVKHILIDCIDFEISRRKYFNVFSMRQLFEDTHPSKILLYLKEIGLFYRF
ncbi:hypothetical protein CAPTEDRAFT_202466 [Capitella teleta]|uniref:RNase H type-1 domain-containing protein n=1 Tax=Capitella teleta TaxID=283909 RepID=R7UIM9_CAPTE|nr:hypothetical protein CAPTEDRAFT_202466 [Capitella teleta]|eukprot:ELU05953.1 hypothetical protein CAPTEDRAFT_202466 [Capitella teleta]